MGDDGAALPTHLPDSTLEASDSSHSGMVAGAKWLRRVGLEGADAAKRGWRRKEAETEPLDRDSQSGFRFGALDVGEERGGVTGALLEIRRGGREVGMAARFRRKGRR